MTLKVTTRNSGSTSTARCEGLVVSCTMGEEYAARRAAAKAICRNLGFQSIDEASIKLTNITSTIRSGIFIAEYQEKP